MLKCIQSLSQPQKLFFFLMSFLPVKIICSTTHIYIYALHVNGIGFICQSIVLPKFFYYFKAHF